MTTRPAPEKYHGESLEQWTQHLEIVQNQPYFQVWLHKEDGQSLGAYFNCAFAFVLWFGNDGDSAQAFHSEHEGHSEMQEFYLENGQLDEYPESVCLCKQDGILALLHFFEHGERPKWLAWNEN